MGNYHFISTLDESTAAGLHVTIQVAHVSVSSPWKKISWQKGSIILRE